jgi:hypothetical protein
MQIHHFPRLHFPIDKKEKKKNYQVLSFCAINSLEKKYYYRLFKGKKTEYHSVYNNSTAVKMRCMLLTIAFSIIGEHRIAGRPLKGDNSIGY